MQSEMKNRIAFLMILFRLSTDQFNNIIIYYNPAGTFRKHFCFYIEIYMKLQIQFIWMKMLKI